MAPLNDDLCTILLIEDDVLQREMVRGLVAARGAGRVVLKEAASMEEGLRLLQTDHFQLVLLDHSLPQGSSLDELRRVRAASPALPVVMHTGYISPEDEETALAEGLREVVVKGALGPLWEAILRACPEIQLPDDPGAKAPYTTHTILVVEDDDGVREVIQRSLQDEGYGVVTAANGKRALELIATLPHAVDLVLADVKMPEMGGHHLGRVLAETRPELPVIYMTGWIEEQNPATSTLPAGAVLLPKPFKPDTLIELVRTAIRPAAREG